MPLTLDKVKIRIFNDQDSLEELTDLLHRSYKILADMNLKYLATYQPVDTTRQRIANGICFIAEHEGQIIGTITYYPPDKSKAVELLNITETAWVSQMGIDPDWQRKGLGKMLLQEAEKVAIDNNIPYIGLDTAEYAVHLIKWYSKLGYKFEQYINWDITNYRSVAMIKKLL